MGGKKKKDKKEKKDTQTDQIPALDKQFYELTIADLNNKLIRLRSHNTKIEEQNEELDTKIKEMEEDKADITAYLNRTLNEKLENISDLEDKLTELHKVREDENFEAFNKLKDGEIKYKAMSDELNSEIKLLNGKVNSLEEFRIQRDELMAKFDRQEMELKDERRRHKEVFSEMEQKAIYDRNRLRKEVERKLLELSDEFNKTRELRVAAHTQRLVRENIALNNQMDKMILTQLRLKQEHEEMIKSEIERKQLKLSESADNNRLIKTCKSQVKIIEGLTEKFEKIKTRDIESRETKVLQNVAFEQMKTAQRDAGEMRKKVKTLEQYIETIDSNRRNLKVLGLQTKSELERIFSIMKTLRTTVKSAIVSKPLKRAQREDLLADLMNILTAADDPSIPTSFDIVHPPGATYKLGNIGLVSFKDKFLLRKKIGPKPIEKKSEEPDESLKLFYPQSRKSDGNNIIDIEPDGGSDIQESGSERTQVDDKKEAVQAKEPVKLPSKAESGSSEDDDGEGGVSPDEFY